MPDPTPDSQIWQIWDIQINWQDLEPLLPGDNKLSSTTINVYGAYTQQSEQQLPGCGNWRFGCPHRRVSYKGTSNWTGQTTPCWRVERKLTNTWVRTTYIRDNKIEWEHASGKSLRVLLVNSDILGFQETVILTLVWLIIICDTFPLVRTHSHGENQGQREWRFFWGPCSGCCMLLSLTDYGKLKTI